MAQISYEWQINITMLTIVLFLLIGVDQIKAIPNPLYGSSQNCAVAPYTSADACSAYCSYQVDSAYHLTRKCSGSLSDNGLCTACDELVFALHNPGGFCIPHLYNSQAVVHYIAYSGWYLGFWQTTSASQFNRIYQISITQAHYAIRARFGVFFANNQNLNYQYYLMYSVDTKSYSYNQSNMKYFSCYDIITTPLQTHYTSTLTITYRNNQTGYPDNLHGCAANTCTCVCWNGFTNGCHASCNTYTCCDYRYIQIRDLIVFASLCPSECAACVSASTCTSCITNYVLNFADGLCYSSCPQATYLNDTMYPLGGTTATYPGYTPVNQTFCVPCEDLCMECTNSTMCTRCYTIGRNQSYLFNNTCVRAPCPNGFFANMTNHTCDCPEDYFYPTISYNFLIMTCNACSFQCVRCSGPTNLECTVCAPGFYLANGTTFCLTKCPDGQFIFATTQICYFCDISCSRCQNSSTNCISCLTNTARYLFGNRCYTSCPPGYSWNNLTHTCDLCDFYTYSYLGACITICPEFYEANSANRSCIPYSQTSFHFSFTLEEVHVMKHGKLLQYTILAQDGLNTTSQDWIKYKSYFSAQVLYKDSQLNEFRGVRSLMNVSLPIRNLNYYNNRITYTTNIPDGLDYHKSFQIVFLSTLYGLHNIKYSNLTNVYEINQHPQLMKEYYTYSIKNYYHFLMLPFLTIAVFLLALQIKGTYELIMESMRIVQILGLLLYTAFPVGACSYYFLIGCSYANLDFIPNLYAKFAKTDSSSNFASYYMGSTDMDFIRLMGSIIFFGVVMLAVYLICCYLFKLKQSRLDFIARFSFDLMEIKIFHSFWSSLLYIIVNYLATEFGMFIIFVLALCFLGGIIARRYSIWKDSKDLSPLFVWRAAGTLLICFVALANELIVSLLLLVGIGITMWQFFSLHSDKYKVNINDLNSTNYMNEATFKVLNDYDIEVAYSFSISLRNTLTIICSFLAAILAAILVLLRDAEDYSIFFTVGIIYLLLLLILLTTILIFKFLEERRRFLVQNKLEYLQKKYAKLGARQTQIYEERRRPRVMSTSLNFDDEKYFDGLANRSMMKSFD